MKLPDSMLANADRSTNEEAWRPDDFPRVLDLATVNRLVCIGGQFQFRGPIGIAEMYGLNADSTPQHPDENWVQYVERANSEVRNTFDMICATTDFNAEAMRWENIREAIESGRVNDPREYLYFVAYFSQEPNKAEQAVAHRPA